MPKEVAHLGLELKLLAESFHHKFAQVFDKRQSENLRHSAFGARQ